MIAQLLYLLSLWVCSTGWVQPLMQACCMVHWAQTGFHFDPASCDACMDPFNFVCCLQEQIAEQHVAQVSDSSGRLPPDALRQLLELQAQAAGGPLKADQLLSK